MAQLTIGGHTRQHSLGSAKAELERLMAELKTVWSCAPEGSSAPPRGLRNRPNDRCPCEGVDPLRPARHHLEARHRSERWALNERMPPASCTSWSLAMSQRGRWAFQETSSY